MAPFTVDTRALKGALGEVDPFGATSLHDAISAAAERVATRPMARRAVVGGCGGGNYCPTASVTREQMGVFLGVTFGLTLYGP